MSDIEQHVPCLETCKRMKELGWSKDCFFQWGRYYDWQWDAFGEPTEEKKYSDGYSVEMADELPDHVYFEAEHQAPILSEVLEALPAHLVYNEEFDEDGMADDFYQLTMTTDNCSLYLHYITVREGKYHPVLGVCSSNPTEAAALLWCKLVEEGIISSNEKE